MLKYVTEFLGTCLLLLTILLTGNPLMIGAALAAAAAGGGSISGGHYNPVVSIVMLVKGELANSDFMGYLDNVILELESDLFCKYKKLTKEIRNFIDEILVGLYNLKKTYPDCKEVVAKVDSIILTLIDFKDKSEAYVNQKNTNIKLSIGQSFEI